MATEEPKKKFDAHAKHFFLTYSQSTPLDHQYLHTKLLNIHPNVYNVYSCREPHQDGSYHHHAIVSFDPKFRTRNCRFFDVTLFGVTYHPEFKPVKKMPNAIEYIGKNGTTLGDSSRIDRKHKESKYSAILDNATTSKGFMDLVRQEDPRSYVLNHERLEYFAKRKFGDFTEPIEPEFKTEDFVNVPQEVFDWAEEALQKLRLQDPLDPITTGLTVLPHDEPEMLDTLSWMTLIPLEIIRTISKDFGDLRKKLESKLLMDNQDTLVGSGEFLLSGAGIAYQKYCITHPHMKESLAFWFILVNLSTELKEAQSTQLTLSQQLKESKENYEWLESNIFKVY